MGSEVFVKPETRVKMKPGPRPGFKRKVQVEKVDKVEKVAPKVIKKKRVVKKLTMNKLQKEEKVKESVKKEKKETKKERLDDKKESKC